MGKSTQQKSEDKRPDMQLVFDKYQKGHWFNVRQMDIIYCAMRDYSDQENKELKEQRDELLKLLQHVQRDVYLDNHETLCSKINAAVSGKQD